MVTTQQITPAQFLDLYSRKALEDPVGPIKIGAENRIYGRTTEQQANNPEGYIVVYAVI